MKTSILLFALAASSSVWADDIQDCYSHVSKLEALAPLGKKVAIVNSLQPSVEILTNTHKPNKAERPLIALWMSELEKCMKDNPSYDFSNLSTNISTLMTTQQTEFFGMTADLHAGKLTYGEYSRARAKTTSEFLVKLKELLDAEEAKRASLAKAEDEKRRQEYQAVQRREYQERLRAEQEEAEKRQAVLNFLSNRRPYQAPQLQPYQIPTPTTTNCTSFGNQVNCITR